MRTSQRIQNALHKASETEAFILDQGTRKQTAEIFHRYFPGKTPLVVADDITFAVAGKDVQTSFAQTGNTLPEPYVFPGHPILHADYVHIERLRDVLQDQPNTIPIAVGSGTINDLVKRAAYEVERRYMVVATAASVDGYSSFGAAH